MLRALIDDLSSVRFWCWPRARTAHRLGSGVRLCGLVGEALRTTLELAVADGAVGTVRTGDQLRAGILPLSWWNWWRERCPGWNWCYRADAVGGARIACLIGDDVAVADGLLRVDGACLFAGEGDQLRLLRSGEIISWWTLLRDGSMLAGALVLTWLAFQRAAAGRVKRDRWRELEYHEKLYSGFAQSHFCGMFCGARVAAAHGGAHSEDDGAGPKSRVLKPWAAESAIRSCCWQGTWRR